MFDPALTQLMRMLMRAGLRQAWRMLKKPSGALFTLFMLAMIAFGLLPNLIMSYHNAGESNSVFAALMAGSIPIAMYAMAAIMVATDSGETLLELKPPELQFVLAGPFSNSQILSYRLLTLAIGWIPMSLFFALFLLPHVGSFLGGLLGIGLGGAFITLIAFQYTLVKSRLSPGVLRTVRLLSLTSLAIIAAEAGAALMRSGDPPSLERISESVNGGWVASTLSLPFQPFSHLMTGGMGIGLLWGTLLCGVLVAAITFSCYRTNGGFSELAVEGVARRQRKLERIRGGNVYGISTRKKERTQLLPAFGWLGGVGPVAWSQMTSALRRTGRLVPGIFVLGVIAALAAALVVRLHPNAIPVDQRGYAVPIALGVSAYLGFLVSLTAQTGFSANRHLLTWYQTLPIPPVSIAIGMVIGTATLLIAIQCSLCLPALVVTTHTAAASMAVLFAGIAYSVAFASMINFISATTGLRPMPGGTPDVFQGARALTFMLVLGLSMMPIILFAIGSAAVAGAVLGFSWTFCSLAAGFTMLAGLPVLWWYAGKRFMQSEPVND